MRLRPEPLQIGPRDGFKPELDLFGYSRFGRSLANLIDRLEGPSVLVLHGPWGSGKSVFAKQWAGLLRQRQIDVLEFNALESDHGDDPFVLLAGKLLGLAERERLSVAGALDKSSNVMAASLVPLLANLLVKTLSGGLLNAKDLVLETRNALQERIKEAEEMPAAVGQFRDAAETMMRELLTRSKRAEGEGATGLVVIIDELDRCRPVFALRLLERIRHLFSVPGLCFVLVTDIGQIARAAHKEYGLSESDARVFLRKYYDRHFDLQGSATKYVLDGLSSVESQRYVSRLWHGLSLGANEDVRGAWDIGCLNLLVRAHRLDFRSIEQVVANMQLFSMTVDRDFKYWHQILSAMSVARVVNSEFYSKGKRGELRAADVKPFMKYDAVAAEYRKEVASRFENVYRNMWLVALAHSEEEALQAEGGWDLHRSLGTSISPTGVLGPSYPTRMVEEICAFLDEVLRSDVGS